LTKTEFISHLSNNLGFAPTEGQSKLFSGLTDFLASGDTNRIFVVKGYAGTGKTSIVRSIVKTFPLTSLKVVLMAPTGKAAKVLSAYTGKTAFTIHKRIYFSTAGDLGLHFALQKNMHTNTVFVVDEASMIGSESLESGHNLLEDLLLYIESGENCRLILIGDTAQLPPVGFDESPALDKGFLERSYSLSVDLFLLDEVMRQGKDSGILTNATILREELSKENSKTQFHLKPFPDVRKIDGYELEDALHSAYSTFGDEEVLVITRSNKNANQYNRQIRSRIRWQESEIAAGDYLMIVRNNYFWLPESHKQGFIANGDTVEVLRIKKIIEKGTFRFAEALVRFTDYPDEDEHDVIILLDTLDSEQPALPWEQQKKLYEFIKESYEHIPSLRERNLKIKQDPFMNALQVKFAWAVTCHKAQGGQWKCVFVDHGYLTEEMLDKSMLRWLYTAITRARERLYLVNFNKIFFEEEL